MPNVRRFPHQRLLVIEQDANIERRLAIFVHGLGGNYLASWGRLADILRSSSNLTFQSWDYAFFGYDTATLSSALDVVTQLDALLYDAQSKSAMFPSPYEKFALIGHSLGALAARQLAVTTCIARSNVSLVERIALIGEPLAGSGWAKYTQLRLLSLRPLPVLDDLVPRSTFTRQLRNWCDCSDVHHATPKRSIYHTQTDWVIDVPNGQFELASNDPAPILIPGVHWTMTTITSGKDVLFTELERFLR